MARVHFVLGEDIYDPIVQSLDDARAARCLPPDADFVRALRYGRGVSISDVARAHHAYFQATESTEPQVICGFSRGAAVALELARLYSHRPAVVALDLVLPQVIARAKLFRRVRNAHGEVADGPRLRALAEFSWERMRLAMSSAADRERVREHGLIRALERWQPAPYDGEVIACVSGRHRFFGKDPSLGWSQVQRDVRVEVFDCDHMDFVALPHAERVAELCRR